ncbi:MAG TPA: STAS domain-containing protein [Mycobacteriales bacterium]|nr:STAS domain-containing protein [Mycobacteriales bacterium]HWA66476.1 STAS domain-containing protein [Mycobacteriales bacterium]
MDPISCKVEQLPTATVVHVYGEVDVAGAPVLREALISVLAEPCSHLIVDLSGVDFLDSTGIGVIVAAHTRALAQNGRFSAVVTTTAVRKVLQITGLLRAWRVTGSIEDALSDV